MTLEGKKKEKKKKENDDDQNVEEMPGPSF